MQYDTTRNSPAPCALAPPHTPDRAHWTPSKQRIFLAALLETGSVTSAASAAGMNRSSAQRLRRHLADTPFDRTWTAVLRQHAARLADPFAERRTAASPPPERRVPDANAPRR